MRHYRLPTKFLFPACAAFSAFWPSRLTAAERVSGVNTESPDTIVLSLTIRDYIVKTSGEGGKPEDLKAYKSRMTKGPKPEEFTMMPIPGGEFLMGSPPAEKDRRQIGRAHV